MKKTTFLTLSMLIMLSSCSSYTTTGAGFGGVIGSAIGGIAGGHRGHDVGTLVGMAAGAATGAAIENAQQQRYQRRVAKAVENDDVYSDGTTTYRTSPSRHYGTPNNDAKSRRIQQYHDNVERRLSSEDSGFTINESQNQNNGFRLEPTDDKRLSRQETHNTEQTENSGYSSTAKYDDRIEIK